LNVLHSIAGLDLQSGGPSQSTFSLVKGLNSINFNATILTYCSENKQIASNSFIVNVEKPFELRFGYSCRYKKELKKQKLPDIIHTHGLWQYPPHSACTFAIKNSIPLIISPRGMLYPNTLDKSNGLKKIALFFFQHNDLINASVIHATCKQEKEHIRAFGLKNPIAVIPNPVQVNTAISKQKQNNRKKRIAFIGRLNPIKNLEQLMKAWSQINNEMWEMVLIGDGEDSYTQSLRNLAIELNIPSLLFTGFLFGEEKEKILQTIDLVVLPSISENFGMVVAEALQHEIPVIASTGTPWEDLQTYGCGWWVKGDVENIALAIKQAISLSDRERNEMGQKGRRLILDKYSTEKVVLQMKLLYDWVLDPKKQKPEFIYE
jgi:glycosyltransferase involved in cell wall biosynthesis